MARKILVMPQFNESRTILPVLSEVAPYVDSIVIVNDGSTDVSIALIGAWMRENRAHRTVYLVSLPKNQGMSGALLAGFCQVLRLLNENAIADDDLIINIDADGQHSPSEIQAMCDYLIQTDSEVLLGFRDFSGYPQYKQVGNKGLSWWATFLSGFHYNDVECGFRVMRGHVVRGLLHYFTGRRYGCAQEIGIITAVLGYRIKNDFPTSIRYYRQGARFRDGIVNMTMGFIAFLRSKLQIKSDLDALLQRVLGKASLLTQADLEKIFNPAAVEPQPGPQA
jgi:glycosyltransferase involved in cell wall biosynthesis